MSVFNETIPLSSRDYDKTTRRWRIPILTLRGVRLLDLLLDGQPISPSEYTLSKNVASFSESSPPEVRAGTKAHAVVEISERTVFYEFWVPIVCAVVGLVGALGQPILHWRGILYPSQRSYRFNLHEWGIDDANRYYVKATISPPRRSDVLTDDDIRTSELLLAVRTGDTTADPGNGTYDFVSGPHPLSDPFEKSIRLGEQFVQAMETDNETAECVVFLVRGNITIKEPFEPAIHGDALTVISRVACGGG